MSIENSNDQAFVTPPPTKKNNPCVSSPIQHSSTTQLTIKRSLFWQSIFGYERRPVWFLVNGVCNHHCMFIILSTTQNVGKVIYSVELVNMYVSQFTNTYFRGSSNVISFTLVKIFILFKNALAILITSWIKMKL